MGEHRLNLKRIMAAGAAFVIFAVTVFAGGCSGSADAGDDVQADKTLGGASGGTSAQVASPVYVSEWEAPLLTVITGAGSDEGISAAWGLDAAIQRINEEGGIRGVPVKSVLRDTSSKPEKAAEEMMAVAETGLIVFGPPIGGQDFLEAGNIAVAAGLPCVGYVESGEISEFTIIDISAETGAADSEALGLWFGQNSSITSVCMILDPSKRDAEHLQQKLMETITGASLEYAGTIHLGNTDFDADQIAKQAIETGANAFYIDATPASFARLVAMLKFKGIDGKMILGSDTAASTRLLEATASYPEDIEDVMLWSPTGQTGSGEQWQIFVENCERGGAPDSELAADFYDAVIIFKLACEDLSLTCDPSKLDEERAALLEYLMNSPEVVSLRGGFKIVDGAKIVTPQLMRVSDHAFTVVKTDGN